MSQVTDLQQFKDEQLGKQAEVRFDFFLRKSIRSLIYLGRRKSSERSTCTRNA